MSSPFDQTIFLLMSTGNTITLHAAFPVDKSDTMSIRIHDIKNISYLLRTGRLRPPPAVNVLCPFAIANRGCLDYCNIQCSAAIPVNGTCPNPNKCQHIHVTVPKIKLFGSFRLQSFPDIQPKRYRVDI
jgi:hypothetical protein